jgi:hypothetical protein
MSIPVHLSLFQVWETDTSACERSFIIDVMMMIHHLSVMMMRYPMTRELLTLHNGRGALLNVEMNQIPALNVCGSEKPLSLPPSASRYGSSRSSR